eukprot:scaffold200079_cov12-Tisochrysis_lutea.AAC.1
MGEQQGQPGRGPPPHGSCEGKDSVHQNIEHRLQITNEERPSVKTPDREPRLFKTTLSTQSKHQCKQQTSPC